MEKLVRGGLLSVLTALFVVVMYAQAEPERDLSIANYSQPTVNNPITTAETTNTDEKKLVKKTVINKAAGASRGASRGSFTATAYCLKGKTAMGHGVRKGIIAADPRVLRLGSRINLGAGAYSGNYLVSDTGGRIKGRKLDIWMASCSEARRFGRRTVTVAAPEEE
jgi:3D (Asp-Asp-Asp) domain-containing protein